MASLVFSLLLTIFTVQCTFNSSAEMCTNPLPGLMQMASGVDITALDLFPLGDSADSHGLRENVLNFSCSGAKLGFFLDRDPQLSVYGDYDLPVQIGYVSMNHKTNGDVVRPLVSSEMGHVKAKQLSRLGINDSPGNFLGAFSRNFKYTSLLKQHFESNKVFTDMITISSTVNPYIEFLESWKNFIGSRDFVEFTTRNLSQTYEENPAIYRTFIKRYGTHYFRYVQLSEYDYVQFALESDYYLDTSDGQIRDGISASYFDYFKSNQGKERPSNETASPNHKAFTSASEITLAYSAREDAAGGHSRWVDKLTGRICERKQFTGMSIRQADLEPIDGLIKNKTIQAQVKIAVKIHLIEAQLDELANIYKFSAKYYRPSDKDKSTFENVKTFANLGDAKQIDQMIKNLSQLYDRVLQAKEKVFDQPVIYDLTVLAAIKWQFEKQICAPRCPARHGLYYADVPHIYGATEARNFNLQYGLRDGTRNGFKVGCTKC